jgi:hypothetical protein
VSLSLFSLRQSVHCLWGAVKQRLRQRIRPDTHSLVLNVTTDLTRTKSGLVPENVFLRQQLIVLKRQVKHPSLTWRDRALLVLLASRLRR